MQLLIELPDKVWEKKVKTKSFNGLDVGHIIDAMNKGIVLPKGHGNLIAFYGRNANAKRHDKQEEEQKGVEKTNSVLP